MTLLLQVEGITKRFSNLQALTNVTFDLPKGQTLGIIGPKGAGKTTLLNCINGIHTPEEGRIRFMGKDVTRSKTYNMAKHGLARTYPIPHLFKELSVRENVIVAACFGHENHNLSSAKEIATDEMEYTGIGAYADQPIINLNIIQKKRLELARVLAARPHLLLLDEIFTGLTSNEIIEMMTTIKGIRERGITIVMAEHVIKAVVDISDRVIVLEYGRQIAQGIPKEIVRNQQMIRAYLGNPNLATKLMGKRD